MFLLSWKPGLCLPFGVAGGSICPSSSKMYKVITQQTQIWTLEKDYIKVLLCSILEVAIGSLANASNRKCIHTDRTSPNSTVKQIFPINWESKFLPDHLLQAVGGRGQCLITCFLFCCHPHIISHLDCDNSFP